jgi:hypothetical protein
MLFDELVMTHQQCMYIVYGERRRDDASDVFLTASPLFEISI